MRIARLVTLAFAAAASTSLARGGVIVVAAGGGGGFTDLPAAVAAASDGDVLLVKSGSYSGFTITNKALDVVADAGAAAQVSGRVVIASLAAARSVTLAGLVVVAPATSGQAVAVQNCAGAVRIQGCSIRGLRLPACGGGNPVSSLELVNSSDVSVARCTLSGADGFEEQHDSSVGGDALVAVNSRCALYDCTLLGGRGGDWSGACTPSYGYGYAGDGGVGLTVYQSAFVFASGCSIRGGTGGNLLGLANSEGCGGYGWYTDPNSGNGGSRILDTLVAGGVAGSPQTWCGALPRPPFGGQPPVTLQPPPARSLAVPRVLRENAILRVDVTGVPGEAVDLVFSQQPDFVHSDSWRGVRLVRWKPSPLPVLRLGTIAANGELHVALSTADLGPGVAARRVFLQTVHDGNGTGVCLGPVTTLVMLDSAF